MLTFFLGLMLVHGAIHLLGFLRAFGLIARPDKAAPIPRERGVLWLVAALLVWGAAATWLDDPAPSWWLGGVAVALSQGLIIASWREARWGTFPNLALLFAVLLAFGEHRFLTETRQEMAAFIAPSAAQAPEPVDPARVEALPAPVQRWLRTSGALDRPRPRAVKLRQQGELQVAPGQGFEPAEAEQLFTLSPPAFYWRVRTRLNRMPVYGRDIWQLGRGRMRIEIAGLLPGLDEAGPEVDQGALLRFLGETVWFPAGALSSQITWAPIADAPDAAQATMRFEGTEATGRFDFDADGRFLSLSAERYQGGAETPTLVPWVARATEWGQMAGVLVPTAGEVVWELEEGPYVYYRWRLTELRYDPSP